jgi:photosystem II stability/assembly factor-like uncharacterized protein
MNKMYAALMIAMISLLPGTAGLAQATPGAKKPAVPATGDVASFWIPSNAGIEKESITALVVTDDGTVLAGSDLLDANRTLKHYTLFRSADGGKTWTNITERVPVLDDPKQAPAAMRKMVVDSQRVIEDLKVSGNTIYAVASQGTTTQSRRRLLRSKDRGDSWIEIGRNVFPTARDSQLVTGENGRIYVNNHQSIFQSNDEGGTWTTAYDGPLKFFDLIVVDGEALVAGTGRHGVYRSSDGGRTWERTDKVPVGDLGPRNNNVWSLQRHPSGSLYALFSYGEKKIEGVIRSQWLYRSSDSGRSWEEIRYEGVAALRKLFPIVGDGFIYADAAPLGSGLIVSSTGPSHMYRSADGGAAWVALQGLPREFINAFAMSPDGTLYAGMSVSGVYRSHCTWPKRQYFIAFKARHGAPGHAFVQWIEIDHETKQTLASAFGLYPKAPAETLEDVLLQLGDVPGAIVTELSKEGAWGDDSLLIRVDEQTFRNTQKIREEWAVRMRQGTDSYSLLAQQCVDFVTTVARELRNPPLEVPSKEEVSGMEGVSPEVRGTALRVPYFFIKALRERNKGLQTPIGKMYSVRCR